MHSRYPVEVRKQVVELARSGTRVAQLAETAAWPRMRKRGGRVQPEPVRGLFVGGRASDVMAC
jgi:hypothetical protein